MVVHEKLGDLRTWTDIDISDEKVKTRVNQLIDSDCEKDSPTILKGLQGRYSPYKKHLSNLGKTQLDTLKAERTLSTTAYTVLAVAKFKNLLKKKE